MTFKNKNYIFFSKTKTVALSCKLLSVAVGCLMVIVIVIGAVVTDVETKLDVSTKA